MTCSHCGGRLVPYSDITFSDGEVRGVQCIVCGREPAMSSEREASLRAEQQRRPGTRMYPQSITVDGQRLYL